MIFGSFLFQCLKSVNQRNPSRKSKSITADRRTLCGCMQVVRAWPCTGWRAVGFVGGKQGHLLSIFLLVYMHFLSALQTSEMVWQGIFYVKQLRTVAVRIVGISSMEHHAGRAGTGNNCILGQLRSNGLTKAQQ